MLFVIGLHHSVERGAYPSIKTVCQESGLSRMTVWRALRELEELNLVRVEHDKNRVHFFLSVDERNNIVAPDDVSELILNDHGKPAHDVSVLNENVSVLNENVSGLIHASINSDTPIGTRARPEVSLEVSLEGSPSPAAAGDGENTASAGVGPDYEKTLGWLRNGPEAKELRVRKQRGELAKNRAGG